MESFQVFCVTTAKTVLVLLLNFPLLVNAVVAYFDSKSKTSKFQEQEAKVHARFIAVIA